MKFVFISIFSKNFVATTSPCLLCTVTMVTFNVLVYKFSAKACLLVLLIQFSLFI